MKASALVTAAARHISAAVLLHNARTAYCDGMLADAQEQDENIADDLEELRELLGVAEDPEHDTAAHGDDAPDSESRHELQRLRAHLDSPVSAGSEYTVLQVQYWGDSCVACMFGFVSVQVWDLRSARCIAQPWLASSN